MQRWTEMTGKGTEAELAVKTKATRSGDSELSMPNKGFRKK